MIGSLYTRWMEDQYYTHGFLVPFLCVFIAFRRWPKIRALAGDQIESPRKASLPVALGVSLAIIAWTGGLSLLGYSVINHVMALMPNAWAGAAVLAPMVAIAALLYGGGISLANRVVGFQFTAMAIIVALLPLVYVSYLGNIIVIQGWLFVAIATLAVAAVAGWKWALGFLPSIAFLLFGFPVWNWVIDGYTNWLQLTSTSVAYQLLQATGFRPLQTDPTTIYLNNFQLNVAVPCSGMKLLLAVSAFTTLFVLIANLRFWSNVFMFALVVPLCLFINGLRIALIGIVGNEYGHDAGIQFHDISGYITLVVCFFLLFKFARLLGWKN